jgi:3-keto-disaccharide hydrolase
MRTNEPAASPLLRLLVIVSLVFAAAVVVASSKAMQEPGPFPPPKTEPPVVTPGKTASDPPSDAVVLFDGGDLSKWRSTKTNGDPKWTITNGYAQVAPGTGDIATRELFGDCQLHIEWATPAEVKGDGQERGNSGVFLMERYEVQVLDSYQNKTYYHGQAGAVYNQYAPLVNASRKPGEWQSYDIIFKAPKFDEQGKVTERARVTVLHNGVLIQNNVEIYGNTWHDRAALYIAHGDASLKLQDHGNAVRYRNIWIRRL